MNSRKELLADLEKVLRVAKSANEKKIAMCIWDHDITTLENVVAYLAALTSAPVEVPAQGGPMHGQPPALPFGWTQEHAAKAAWMINTLAITPTDEWRSKAELFETMSEFRALTPPAPARLTDEAEHDEKPQTIGQRT